MDRYEITLTDGSTMVVEANSPEEATQIATRKIQEKYATPPQPAAAPSRQMTTEETIQDVAAGAARGMAPYATGAALGAAAGAPFYGVGAIPGAAAGVAAVGAAQFIGDPLVDAVNSLFGTKFTKPTDALNQLMDAAGMPKPQSEAGQVAEKVAAGVSGGLSGVGAARSIAAGAAPGTLTQGVAQTMAAAPVSQAVGGGTGAGAAEIARQQGASPLVQMGAGLAGGMAGGLGTSMLAGGRGGIPSAGPGSPMLEQDFGNAANVTLRVPIATPSKQIPMTYEDVARDTRTAATGGMGSQQAVERLARAAKINKDAAAAAERLGIDVPPDVLIDHTQLKEAIGLTRSMPGTVASAAWADAVERAATQADEAMAKIDGSPDLADISDTVLQSMNRTQADLQKQADEMYARINDRIKKAGQPEGAAAASSDLAALKQQGFNTDTVYYHGTYQKDFDTFDMSKVGTREVPWYGAGVYLSPDRNIAKRYGDKVLSFYVRGKLLTVDKDNPWPEWLNNSADIKKQLADRGYVGLQINNTTKGFKYDNKGNVVLDEKGIPVDVVENMPETVVFDPANIVRADKGAGAKAGRAPPIVDLVNSRRLMNEVVKDLGGDTKKLTPLERDMMEMSSIGRETPVTYAALMRMKNDVGQALQKASGPYKDVNTGILKRLYGALSEDQLQYVQEVGGDSLRADLRTANQIVAKRKALEDRIVSLFGDQRDGSIARKLVSTIQGGAKGDITGFNRVVRSLPEDLRKRAVASAIAGAAREEKTNGFGFAKYVNLYQGLRRNAEVYKTIATTLGPEGDKFLRDLYEISKRITDARAQVMTTGKANQALVQGLTAEGLVEQVLRSTVGRQTIMGSATAATGLAAGPVAGAATAMLTNAITQGNKKALNAAGELFASPEWQQLVIQLSTKQNMSQKVYNAAKTSEKFRNWAKVSGITDPDQWLRSAVSSSIGTGIAIRRGHEATE